MYEGNITLDGSTGSLNNKMDNIILDGKNETKEQWNVVYIEGQYYHTTLNIVINKSNQAS
jgi:hypothetical protein